MSYPNRRGGGTPGADGKQVELQEGSGYVQWRYVGDTIWRNLMPLSDISGDDGRSVNLRVNTGWVQWQHDGDSVWQNLMSMDDMRAADGEDGADGTDGENGVGISSQATTYQESSSGTSPPAGAWTSAVPSINKGTYLWTRIVLTLTDGSSSTSYAVAYQAADGLNGTNGTNGANYTPQAMTSRTVTVATPYRHNDLTKPFKVMLNARSTQTVTVAGLVNDRVELRVGPSASSVAPGGSGGFSVGVWESGITGIALMVGAAVQDGGQLTADVPAGWYFQINRLSGTNATIVSCFTQSMS